MIKSKEFNDKNPKFKISDNVRISKYKNVFAKGDISDWSEGFVIKKVKNAVTWTYLLMIFMEKNYWSVLRKQIAKNKSKRI